MQHVQSQYMPLSFSLSLLDLHLQACQSDYHFSSPRKLALPLSPV